MDRKRVENWLISQHSSGISGYSQDAFAQYTMICILIFDKIMNPDIKECSFIEAVYKGDLDKAKAVGDLHNKAAIAYGLYQNFVTYVKTSSEYIIKIREEKLKILEI
jgi:Na+-transporting NADH:ubiquinone oxidoreductase subunit NqrA